MVYKHFDLVCEEHDESVSCRQPELSLQFIPDAVLFTTVHCRILRYPLLRGSWLPTHGGHLRSAVKALRRVHRAGFVHGDIRLQNFVFEAVDEEQPLYQSHLIDFDYSRASGSEYPTDLSDVPDGQRHPVAAARSGPMEFSHDDFSLRFLLRKFRPCDTDAALRALFKDAMRALDYESVSFHHDALRALKRFTSTPIEMRRSFADTISQSGLLYM